MVGRVKNSFVPRKDIIMAKEEAKDLETPVVEEPTTEETPVEAAKLMSFYDVK